MADITYLDIVNKWRERGIKSSLDLSAVLSDVRILFAYHSNQIEGAGVSLHQTREIFENGKVVGYTGDLRAIFETENQKVCFEFLKEKIAGREKLTSELVCVIHEQLCHGCYDTARWEQGERPGEFKKHFYGVGMDAGVAPEDVAYEIEFLCNELAPSWPFDNSVDMKRVMTAAAYFHCNFESIHPFADGNGRCGRTLLNYILMCGNLPPVVIFEEDKEFYYEALALFDKTDNLDPFLRFLELQMVKTWTRTDRRGKTFITI